MDILIKVNMRFFYIILIETILMLTTLFSQNNDKISLVILEQIKNESIKNSVINFQEILIKEFSKVDSIQTYSDLEIDSMLQLYKVEKLNHTKNFTSAIGGIFNSDYIIQTINTIKNDTNHSKICLFNVHKRKYVLESDVTVLNNQIKIKENIFASLVKEFSEHILDKKNISLSKYEKEIPKISQFIDSLNTNIQKKATIVVEADYYKSLVILNNDTLGTAPILAHNLNYDFYKILVKNLDYSIADSFSGFIYNPVVFKFSAKIAPAWLSVYSNPQSASIKLNDKKLLKNETKGMLVNNTFPQTFSISNDGYYTQEKTFSLKPLEKLEYQFILEPKKKSLAIIYSSIFPGLGQIYRDDTYRGLVFIGLEIGSLISVFNYEQKIIDYKSKYYDTKTKYENASQIPLINSLERELVKNYDKIKDYKKYRNISIGISAGIWLVNIIETMFWKEKPFLGKSHQLSIEVDNYKDLRTVVNYNYTF